MPAPGTEIDYDGLQDVVRSAYCTTLSLTQKAGRAAGNYADNQTARGNNGLLVQSARAAEFFLDNDNRLNDIFCGRAPSPSPPLPVSTPFTGGQCPGTTYEVFAEGTVTGGGDPPFTGDNTVTGIGPVDVVVFYDNNETNNTTGVQIVFGSGTTVNVVSRTAPVAQGRIYASIDNVTITVISGPDNCGDPAPRIDPLEDGDDNTPINVPVTPPGGGSGFEPGDLFVGPPYLDPTGIYKRPYNLVFPDGTNIPGDLVLPTGGVDYGTENQPVSEICCDDVPLEEDDGNEPEDDDRPIVGLSISTLVPSGVQGLTVVGGQGGGPDLYLPDVATVRFLVDIPNGGTRWSEALRVQSLDAYIASPGPAIDFDILTRPGVTSIGTPVRRAPSE